MKKIFEIIVFALITTFAYSAEPIIDLEPFPTLEQFQTYEDSDIWFYNKIIEYYKISIVYQTQIKSIGAIPVAIPQAPSMDDIESIEFKILRKYYSTAEKLKNQVIAMESGAETQKIKELQVKIRSLEQDIFTIKDQNFQYSLEAEKTQYYKNRYQEILKRIDTLQFNLDSSVTNYHNSTLNIYKSMQNIDNNLYSVISFSISANQYYYQNAQVDALLSPGVGFNFNPGKIFGFGRLFDFWADYNLIKSEVKTFSDKAENSTDRFSLGVSLNIPLDDILRIKDFNSTFKVGFGYFHTNTEMTNSNFGSINSNGNIIKLELNFDNFSKYFPFTLYTNLDFNKFNKELVFLGGNNVNLANPGLQILVLV